MVKAGIDLLARGKIIFNFAILETDHFIPSALTLTQGAINVPRWMKSPIIASTMVGRGLVP